MRVLVIELWGLGDAVLATTALKGITAQGHELAIFCKPSIRDLLKHTFPSAVWFPLNAPWTAFAGKYHFWRWNWAELFSSIRNIRKWKPDMVISVRVDPRDHILMKLSGAPQRVGFSWRMSAALLTNPMVRRDAAQHRVEDWRQLGEVFTPESSRWKPGLSLPTDKVPEPDSGKPYIAIHFGARIAVRRWPEAYFSELILALKREFRCRIIGIGERDGYGSGLAPVCDEFVSTLSLDQLTALLSGAALVIANDSAPGHIAAAVGAPVVTINGSANPDWFRPWSEDSIVLQRHCNYRPCFDYCKYEEPFCLTRLFPDQVIPRILKFAESRLECARSGKS